MKATLMVTREFIERVIITFDNVDDWSIKSLVASALSDAKDIPAWERTSYIPATMKVKNISVEVD